MPDLHPTAGAQPAMETRWPCPVCLGVAMQKAVVRGVGADVTIDACARCGGIWFERGEVRQVAHFESDALWNAIPRPGEQVRPPCHGCGARLDRNAERCDACGHGNVLRCPSCDLQMERRTHGAMVLDLCRRCEGVWFDHAELSSIWRLNLTAATQRAARHPGRGGEAMAVGGDVLVNALIWTPDLVIHGAYAATHAASAMAQSVGAFSSSGAAADAASAAAGVVEDAASGVFSMIADIIGGLFEG
ncbi:MAG: zf-TFIIB domain-containing protein [Gemmatimonadaceae bacterium]|nr:zf-TFIIB domain-containing protein [Gemmatimonadaceae bacterium]